MSDARQRRVAEAREVLEALDLPPGQQNDRSAYVLLALLDLGPSRPWTDARDPMRGIHGIMEWIAEEFGFRYAENTRETIRRHTLHQFVQAGLVVRNPDDPARAVNSPRTVYQIDPAVLDLLRSYESADWGASVGAYLKQTETLKQKYASARQQHVVEVSIAPGLIVALTAGGQNPLIKAVVEDFVPQYIRSPRVLYIGDAGAKTGHFDEVGLAELGLRFDRHGQMPDVIVLDGDREWLVLVEAVTSHGPVDPKRMIELNGLFGGYRGGLVFVTAFPDRKTFGRYLADIAWETEVWIADNPTHMIHFDGERFLGPYKDRPPSNRAH